MNEILEAQTTVALKEWAVAVKALAEGRQIIVLRKGGIAEETRDFRLVSRRFCLLPAYEHQKPELLKESYRDGIAQTLGEAHADTVRITACAEAVDDIEIRDQPTLDRVRDFHIWSDTFAEERLRWKKTKPLHLLILRVSLLDRPLELPMDEAYFGCKSWVSLRGGYDESLAAPVLEEVAFRRRAAEIRDSLGV